MLGFVRVARQLYMANPPLAGKGVCLFCSTCVQNNTVMEVDMVTAHRLIMSNSTYFFKLQEHTRKRTYPMEHFPPHVQRSRGSRSPHTSEYYVYGTASFPDFNRSFVLSHITLWVVF